MINLDAVIASGAVLSIAPSLREWAPATLKERLRANAAETVLIVQSSSTHCSIAPLVSSIIIISTRSVQLVKAHVVLKKYTNWQLKATKLKLVSNNYRPAKFALTELRVDVTELCSSQTTTRT